MLGKTKKNKPLAQMKTSRVQKIADNLATKVAAGDALNTRQTHRLARAVTILEKRGPTGGLPGSVPPGTPPATTQVVPDFPTNDPPPGHRWVYNATANAYYPEPIPIVQTTTTAPDLTDYTGTYTTPGGGGTTYPDFTGLTTSQWGTFTDPNAAQPQPVSPLETALNSTEPGASEPMSMTTKIALGAAALGALFLMKRKGRKS